MSDGVWVLGPSRSGTSMLAGLFARHGVFFGECVPGDEDNPKGYWENRWLKQRMRSRDTHGWPISWFERLRQEGWTDGRPWGAKGGPEWWRWVRLTSPTVVVLCYRPLGQIMDSRQRHSWMKPREEIPWDAWRRMEEIKKTVVCPVVSVQTAEVARLDLTTVRPAFDALDLELSDHIARDWIDPNLWTT